MSIRMTRLGDIISFLCGWWAGGWHIFFFIDNCHVAYGTVRGAMWLIFFLLCLILFFLKKFLTH